LTGFGDGRFSVFRDNYFRAGLNKNRFFTRFYENWSILNVYFYELTLSRLFHFYCWQLAVASVSVDDVRDVINVSPEDIPDDKIFAMKREAETVGAIVYSPPPLTVTGTHKALGEKPQYQR